VSPFVTRANSSDPSGPGTFYATRDGSHGSQEGATLHRIVLRDRWHQWARQTIEDRSGQHRGNFLSRDRNAKKAAEISGRRLTLRLGPCPVFTRLRLLITSVLRLIGRARPCSLRNKPHALHNTEPSSSLRHRGVVEVPQFWQTGCNWGRLSSVNVVAIV